MSILMYLLGQLTRPLLITLYVGWIAHRGLIRKVLTLYFPILAFCGIVCSIANGYIHA